ncbi:MAG TPA: hypothetical protein VK252_09605 [Solirubrobacteraceae bacterium]|nr:hypothetical protein [Solirubrobacteraceae bacterium]
MRRKHDAHKDEVEGVAQRLRNERPEASPLELDQIKTSAMSRAKTGTRRGRVGARRLATAGLTVGLLAAGTGGVIAGQDGHRGGGNAANAQYGGECNISNGNGNVGDKNGAGAENNACNENSFNTTTNNITINYPTVTITVPAPSGSPSSGVLGSKTTKATTSKRRIKIHINVSRKSHLRKVTLKLNGKTFKVLKGKQASTNINLTNLPCSSGATTVTIIAVTSSGKTITESHTYHLCQA